MYELTAETIKSLLLFYYRFEKKAVGIDECTYWNKTFIADLLITNFQYITEVEVKLTKSDLLRDFIDKANKHDAFKKQVSHLPNYFYFCVPNYLVDETLKQIELHNNSYGLIEYWNADLPEDVNPMNIGYFFKVIKEPILITEEYSRSLEMTIIRKISSEMCNHKIKLLKKIHKIF